MTYDPEMSEADYRNANGEGGPSEADVAGWEGEVREFCWDLSRMADEALQYRRMVWGRSVMNEHVDEVFEALKEVFWNDVKEPYGRLTEETTLAAPEMAYVPEPRARPVPTNPATYPAGAL